MSLSQILELMKLDPRYTEKLTRRDEVWHGRIFSVEDDEVELPDGSLAPRELVRHPGGAGVVAVHDGRVCLVRQFRVARGRMTLEIPAGKLDPCEDGAAAAARELREETGLVASRLEPLVSVLGSPGFTDERTQVFFATDLVQAEANPDEGELVGALWVELGDVLEAIRAGAIQDGKTVSGVLAAAVLLG